MEIGEVLILVAMLLLFGDLIQISNSKKGTLQKIGFPMAPTACALILGSYLILAQAFISNNFQYEEVYAYSSSGLSIVGRLYASWASSAGSWLFLSFIMALVYLIIRFKMRRVELETKAFQILDILLLFFSIIVLLQSPFQLLPEAQMDGRGLNPLLQTPWMLIHPPIVFIGYVLVFFSLAFTFDVLGSNKPSDSMRMRILAQLAWLFLTLGIALGGVWAYEVLGWGGYWAWDPVETASLIPWITLTAFFHITPPSFSHKTSSRQLLVMVSAALVVLAAAITRGGLAESVHAFGSSPIGFVLLFLMGIIVAQFLYTQRKTGSTLFEFNFSTTSVYSISTSLGFLSLIMITVVTLWGLLFPIINSALGGGSTSMDPSFFNKWNYPFVLLFVMSLIGCHLSTKLTMRKYTAINLALLVLGSAGALLGFPTVNQLANLGIPITLFALGAVVYNSLESVWGVKWSSTRLGRNLIHMGVAFIVLGILLGAPSVIDYGEIVVSPGSVLALEDMSIEFGSFSIIEPFGNVHTMSADSCCNPEAVGLEIPVSFEKGETVRRAKLKILLYTLHGIVSKPLIMRTLEQDVYLVLQQTQDVYLSLVHNMVGMPNAPTEFAVSIKTFPLLNSIWFGVALMCLGIILPISRVFAKKS